MDAIAICVTVPILGGAWMTLPYRVGPVVGVVTYDAAVCAWMADRGAVRVLPPLAGRVWRDRGGAVDAVRRAIFESGARGVLVMRALSEVDAPSAVRR